MSTEFQRYIKENNWNDPSPEEITDISRHLPPGSIIRKIRLDEESGHVYAIATVLGRTLVLDEATKQTVFTTYQVPVLDALNAYYPHADQLQGYA